MIFVGDIALGSKGVKLNFPKNLLDKKIIGNLEGPILDENTIEDSLVYSCKNDIFNNFYLLFLANNHIFDRNEITPTLKYLKKLDIHYTGLCTKEGASMHYIDSDFIYLNFGWSVIGSTGFVENYQIQQLDIGSVLLEAGNALKKNKKVICIFHWGYELELYPQPAHRDLSHKLIDMGVSLIVGHHSHRVQGIEVYKNTPIVYGLGNFLFIQNYFFKGKHKFPDFCNEELAFEFSANGDHTLHWLEYDKLKGVVHLRESEKLSSSLRIDLLTPFNKMSSSEYSKWFKKNRVKSLFLPIYYLNDSGVVVFFKNSWVNIRHNMIRCLVKFKIKKL
jgi:hypothetical protein